MEYSEIDLTTPDGVQLCAAQQKALGLKARDVAAMFDRLFVLTSATAPGLRFVGGMAQQAQPSEATGTRQVFSLAGTGETIEDAFISCVAEAVERLSQIEQEADIYDTAPLDVVGDQVLPDLAAQLQLLLSRAGLPMTTNIDWMAGHCLTTGRTTLVPADWCLRRPVSGTLAIPGAALSTGTAAGSSREMAVIRALLELIERDAAAMWWIGGSRARPVAADSRAMRQAVELLNALRLGCEGRSTWLLDVTTDLAMPCITAVSVATDGRRFASGRASRFSADEAAHAAILEMCQMEVALELSEAKQGSLGAESLKAADRRHLERGRVIDADNCQLLHPKGPPRPSIAGHLEPGETRLNWLGDLAAAHGIDVAIVDLTRLDYGLPVCAAVAPSLQLMPSEIESERLRRAIAAHGGGERWTNGVSLF